MFFCHWNATAIRCHHPSSPTCQLHSSPDHDQHRDSHGVSSQLISRPCCHPPHHTHNSIRKSTRSFEIPCVACYCQIAFVGRPRSCYVWVCGAHAWPLFIAHRYTHRDPTHEHTDKVDRRSSFHFDQQHTKKEEESKTRTPRILRIFQFSNSWENFSDTQLPVFLMCICIVYVCVWCGGYWQKLKVLCASEYMYQQQPNQQKLVKVSDWSLWWSAALATAKFDWMWKLSEEKFLREFPFYALADKKCERSCYLAINISIQFGDQNRHHDRGTFFCIYTLGLSVVTQRIFNKIDSREC